MTDEEAYIERMQPDYRPTESEPPVRVQPDGYAAHANPLEIFYDEDDDDGLCYDPEEDCPRCHGAGKCALLSGIEWDYTGPDYDTCPRCGGSGRL